MNVELGSQLVEALSAGRTAADQPVRTVEFDLCIVHRCVEALKLGVDCLDLEVDLVVLDFAITSPALTRSPSVTFSFTTVPPSLARARTLLRGLDLP